LRLEINLNLYVGLEIVVGFPSAKLDINAILPFAI